MGSTANPTGKAPHEIEITRRRLITGFVLSSYSAGITWYLARLIDDLLSGVHYSGALGRAFEDFVFSLSGLQVITFPIALAFGLATYFFLKHRRLFGPTAYAIAGGIVSLLPILILTFVVLLTTNDEVKIRHELELTPLITFPIFFDVFSVSLFHLLPTGITVAMVFWLIVFRPTRSR